MRLTRPWPLALALLCAAALAACDDAGPESGGDAAALVLVSGDAQTGVAGTQLPEPLVVRVEDERGRPVRGQMVSFVVTAGGGEVVAGAALSNADGEVRERWTLGPAAGAEQRVEARAVNPATGEALAAALFRATAVPGAAVRVVVLSGSGQQGALGAALADSVAVRVEDARGNGVPGVPVEWSVTSGGGSVAAAAATGANGVAKARWTLGVRLDAPQELRARTGTLPPAVLTAVPTLPGDVSVRAVAGDGQRGTAGAALADSLRVEVRLADGRAVQGAPVAWSTPDAGGALSPPAGVTGVDGRAATRWTLGTTAGAQSAVATLPNGVSVTLHATAAAGQATSLTASGGGDQSATVGTTLPQPLQARVTDRLGNGIEGVWVRWTAVVGAGTLDADSSRTDASGVASARWTLGTRAGAVSATASVDGLAPLVFGATALRGPAVLSKIGGDTQSAAAGTALAFPLAVKVADAYGNAYAGVPVTFSGGQRNVGTLDPVVAATDAQGVARTRWTLPATFVGDLLLSASAPETTPVTFSARAVGGEAVALEVAVGTEQTSTVGTPAVPLVVRGRDRYGNVAASGLVRWRVTGGSTLSAESSPIGSDGLARTTASSTLARRDTITATLGNGASALFPLTWNPGPIARVRVTPDTVAVLPGERIRFGMYNYDRYGNSLGGGGFSYTILDPSLIRFDDPTEFFFAQAVGTGRVVLRNGTPADTLVVLVRPSPQPPVASVTLRADTGSAAVGGTVTLLVGQQVTLRGTARDASGLPLSVTFAFASDDPATASILRSDPLGTFVRGVAPGTTQIRATVGGVTGTVTVRVVAATSPAAAARATRTRRR